MMDKKLIDELYERQVQHIASLEAQLADSKATLGMLEKLRKPTPRQIKKVTREADYKAEAMKHLLKTRLKAA